MSNVIKIAVITGGVLVALIAYLLFFKSNLTTDSTVESVFSTKKNNDPLISKAKDNNLLPIPTDKNALNQLIDNKENPLSPEKIELGKKLYFEPRISKSGLISCNTCHNLATSGIDGVDVAIGHKWTANPHNLNSPTVYNAVFAQKQFWDGRSPDLENQAQGPIQAEPEMSATIEHVEKVVTSIPEYVEEFKTAYGKDVEINFELITATIGLFERTLVTTSKYDDYLNGNSEALSDEEKAGLETFIDKGCVTCHNNYALGGSMQPFPTVKPFKFADVGDFKGDENGLVKVPTLRNIEETAPYFHNGTVWDLSEAIKIMGETQLGINLTKEEVAKIVTFLKTLNGEKPEIIYPILPNNSSTTPLPDVK